MTLIATIDWKNRAASHRAFGMSSMGKLFAVFSALMFIACVPSLANAKPGDDVRVQLTQVKVMLDAQRTELLVSADAVKPGDVIEYRATYTNSGAMTVVNLLATLPIPVGAEWIPDTAKPSNAEASRDGKLFAAIPLKQSIAHPDGTTSMEVVPVAEYRYLRWTIRELAAGKDTTVTARIRLQNGPAVAAPTKPSP